LSKQAEGGPDYLGDRFMKHQAAIIIWATGTNPCVGLSGLAKVKSELLVQTVAPGLKSY
jgi:hypothetical protein